MEIANMLAATEEATAYILRGGMPERMDYLLRCLELRLTMEKTNEIWDKVRMTTNSSLQAAYLEEIGYFLR